MIVLSSLIIFYVFQQRQTVLNFALKHTQYPIQCDATQPNWLEALLPLLKTQGYVGIQLSYADHKNTVNCSVGWASLWPLRSLQNSDQLKYASLSKVFTSALILDLIEKNQLSLDDRLFTTLELPPPSDQEMMDISIKHLLQHRAGFDRNISGDLVFEQPSLCPKNLNHLTKYHLDFSPNTQFSYSNFGYCLLGEVVAKKYFVPLKDIYKEQLFQPNKVEISHISENQGTVQYFENFKINLLAFNYAYFTAYGGFVGTAQDFSKILHFIKRQNYFKKVLNFRPSSCHLDQWTGCHGLMMYEYQKLPQQRVYWRDGSLPGVTALTMLFADGRSIVLLANSRTQDSQQHQVELRSALYALVAND